MNNAQSFISEISMYIYNKLSKLTQIIKDNNYTQLVISSYANDNYFCDTIEAESLCHHGVYLECAFEFVLSNNETEEKFLIDISHPSNIDLDVNEQTLVIKRILKIVSEYLYDFGFNIKDELLNNLEIKTYIDKYGDRKDKKCISFTCNNVIVKLED